MSARSTWVSGAGLGLCLAVPVLAELLGELFVLSFGNVVGVCLDDHGTVGHRLHLFERGAPSAVENLELTRGAEALGCELDSLIGDFELTIGDDDLFDQEPSGLGLECPQGLHQRDHILGEDALLAGAVGEIPDFDQQFEHQVYGIFFLGGHKAFFLGGMGCSAAIDFWRGLKPAATEV